MAEALAESEYEIINSVIGFVVIDGLILCLKRSDDDRSFPGKWCFPGGRVDEGERPIEALFRELKEESGLPRSENISFVGKYNAKLKKRKRMYRISAYQLDYSFPVHLQLSSEHSDLKLCTPDEVQELKIAGKVSEAILEEYFKKIGIIDAEEDEE